MKNLWAVTYGSAFCLAKSVFEILTHPVVLLMASGALLLRIIQIAW
jgi:hypothetical protein